MNPRVRAGVLAAGLSVAAGCTGEPPRAPPGDEAPAWHEATPVADWAPRRYAAAVAFQHRMWLLGGSFKGGDRTNAIWSSTDGATWVQEAAHADWSPRSSYAAVVHNDTLWILGGYGPGFTGAFLRDVWRSADGTHWSQATDAAAWTARRYHAAVSFGGRMWILGGFSADGELNDVWATSDGVVWNEVLAQAPWSPRAGLAAVVHEGRLWVLGGDEDSEGAVVTRNDVWSTADGVTWVQATGAAPWEPRRTHTAVAYGGRIWIMGGRSSGQADRFFNDVWSSADGETWVRSTAAAPWRPRRGHTSVAFDGALWLIGGADAGLLGDVWSFRPPLDPSGAPPR